MRHRAGRSLAEEPNNSI